MLFVDASVVVAILTNEPDADELMARLKTAIADNRQLYVSPSSGWKPLCRSPGDWRARTTRPLKTCSCERAPWSINPFSI